MVDPYRSVAYRASSSKSLQVGEGKERRRSCCLHYWNDLTKGGPRTWTFGWGQGLEWTLRMDVRDRPVDRGVRVEGLLVYPLVLLLLDGSPGAPQFRKGLDGAGRGYGVVVQENGPRGVSGQVRRPLKSRIPQPPYDSENQNPPTVPRRPRGRGWVRETQEG